MAKKGKIFGQKLGNSPDEAKKGKGKRDKHSHHSELSDSKAELAMRRFTYPASAWDATLAKLRIKQNVKNKFLLREKEVLPKAPPKVSNYCVKKFVHKPGSRIDNYSVARTARSQTETSLWIPKGHEGMKLDENGRVIPHSILGNVSDYVQTARRLGHLVQSPLTASPDLSTPSIPAASPAVDDQIYQRHADQTHALEWNEQEDTKGRHLRKFLSRRTNRPMKELSMKENDKINKRGGEVQCDPSVNLWDYERRIENPIGFWKQNVQLGDDVGGLHISLKETEKGNPPAREIFGKPLLCRPRDESSIENNQGDSYAIPDIDNLGVSGQRISNKGDALNKVTSAPFSCDPTMESLENTALEEISKCPPTLRIGGKVAVWGEDDKPVQVELGMISHPGEVAWNTLRIVNESSYVFHYQWLRIHGKDPFNRALHCENRLFLDDTEDVVLPFATKDIMCVFKSENAGVFTQTWLLQTKPKLAANAGITLIIWGMAKERKVLGEDGVEIDAYLESKVALTTVHDIISDMIENACVERIDTRPKYKDYPTDYQAWKYQDVRANDLFACVNPGLTYHSGRVDEILNIATLCLPDIEVDRWELPLNRIRDGTFDMAETVQIGKEMVEQHTITQKLMTHVGALSFSVQQPVSLEKNFLCKQILVCVLNEICDAACFLKKIHGITLDMDFKIEMPKIIATKPASAKAHKSPPKSPSRDHKKKKSAGSSQSPPPASMAGKKQQTHTGPSKFSNIIRGIASAKKAQYEHRAKPIMYKKYLEKFYIRTYIIVRNMLDRLQDCLGDYPYIIPKVTLKDT